MGIEIVNAVEIYGSLKKAETELNKNNSNKMIYYKLKGNVIKVKKKK